MKLILVTVLMTFCIGTYAKQHTDSSYVYIQFQEGFIISKRVQIKVNDEIVFKKRIKTNWKEGHCLGGFYSLKFTLEDEITIKIGLFNDKLNKDKIVNDHPYVRANRYFLFNSYSYHSRIALYD